MTAGRKQMTAAEANQAMDMVRAGVAVPDVAATMKRAPSTIWRLAARHDVSPTKKPHQVPKGGRRAGAGRPLKRVKPAPQIIPETPLQRHYRAHAASLRW